MVIVMRETINSNKEADDNKTAIGNKVTGSNKTTVSNKAEFTSPTNSKSPEIQDIFKLYSEQYRQKNYGKLPPHVLRVMDAIEDCRTSVLGGHVRACGDCGTKEIAYNSCRNRHCPKCQTLTKERWINKQKENLLDVGYFHVVFTIPDTLNPVAYQNQKIVYNILFKAVAETLTELTTDPKHLVRR